MNKKANQVPQNESALAGAARDGDRQALSVLLERHWPWLKALTYSILEKADEVDDAMQELCVLAISKIGTLREPERFKSWLAIVARHNALAFLRQRHAAPRSMPELFEEGNQNLIAKTLDPAKRAAQNEETGRLLTGLMKIPEKYREIFILKHYEDMSYSDIADILNIPVTTVQIRLVRARRMMANLLSGRPNHKVPRT